jgi:hypothetical protein
LIKTLPAALPTAFLLQRVLDTAQPAKALDALTGTDERGEGS